MADELTEDVKQILRILRDRKNVLISGPPATGKSKLLSDLKYAFEQMPPTATAAAAPVHDPGGRIPIPAPVVPPPELQTILPSPSRKKRQVFQTSFHQSTKFRDFVTGVVPVVRTTGDKEGVGFRVMTGKLYQASEFAKQPDSAALLIVDEINRGPAIQIFGGSVVAIEADKRLSEDGKNRRETQFFDIVDPETGDLISYALPNDLYIVAAMNQADASVEPLDVAFLRRFVPFALEPNPAILRAYYNRPPEKTELPDAPNDQGDVFEAAIQAWQMVNDKIKRGRGPEFQIGHGILMNGDAPIPTNVSDALFSLMQSWKAIRAHVDEVFFGNVSAIAEILNASKKSSIYELRESMFADEARVELVGPTTVVPESLYELMRAVASE